MVNEKHPEEFLAPSTPLIEGLLKVFIDHRESILNRDLAWIKKEHADLVTLTDILPSIVNAADPQAELNDYVSFLKRTEVRGGNVAGILNFRDMGGLRAEKGKRVKTGVLYRSSNPFAWTPVQAIDQLVGYGFTTDLDLRTEEEAESFPDLFRDKVKYYIQIPFFSEDERKAIELPKSTITERYSALLKVSQKQIAKAAEVLSKPQHERTLLHCKVGKDRTGLVIAVILDALGVKRKELGRDYAISAPLLRPHYEVVKPWAKVPGGGASFAASLQLAFSLLDAHYGGTKNYLRGGGLNEHSLEALAEKLIESD